MKDKEFGKYTLYAIGLFIFIWLAKDKRESNRKAQKQMDIWNDSIASWEIENWPKCMTEWDDSIYNWQQQNPHKHLPKYMLKWTDSIDRWEKDNMPAYMREWDDQMEDYLTR